MVLPALQRTKSGPRTRSLEVYAPAKVNLVLEVLGSRGDGYHSIHSLAIGTGLCDRLTFQWPNPGGLSLTCSDATLHSAENLASRAALALARRKGIDCEVAIEIEKRIPIGAGLGGGSSDAATTLRACNEIWGAGLNELELSELGAELGSDVPLFFYLPSVEISGRGECVRPYPLKWTGYLLLIFPAIHTSTAEVYKAWRAADVKSGPGGGLGQLKELGSADEIQERLYNQLEPAVFRVSPGVKQIHDTLSALGVETRVSGSGSALFRLFDDQDQAQHVARGITRRLDKVAVAVVAGPVGNGALATRSHEWKSQTSESS